MSLDVLTAKGKESITQELRMIRLFAKEYPSFEFVSTNRFKIILIILLNNILKSH
jgi:hypothetical protein